MTVQAIDTRPVDFRTSPAACRHWRLAIDGAVATLTMDVDAHGGLRPGYVLTLSWYDLGPGRAGGGAELGGLRALDHYLNRTALQGHPDLPASPA